MLQITLGLYEGMEGIDLSDMRSHIEWDVMMTTGKHEVKRYECCPEPYESILYELHLKRKSGYFKTLYAGPALLLALLLPFLFLLPHGHGSKVAICKYCQHL